MTALTQSITLEAFLQLPETQPASELLNGTIRQKPMPQGEHSLIQGALCETINRAAKPQKVAMAFPELRCVFGGSVLVPDIAIFRWERIPRTASGRIANHFATHPDWVVEILSPEQSQNKVLGKLLHCLQHGTELGWLVDSKDESILMVLPEQRVQLLQGDSRLPMLSGIELELTVKQVFDWLSLDR